MIPCRRDNVHFILACYTTDYDQSEIEDVLKHFMNKNVIKQATITFIEMIRAYCISKEKYEKFHKQTEVIAEKTYISNHEQAGEKDSGFLESFGNDLESFTNGINASKERIINTFHATMLTQDQKRKLKNDDLDYRKTFWKHEVQDMNPGYISKILVFLTLRLEYFLYLLLYFKYLSKMFL